MFNNFAMYLSVTVGEFICKLVILLKEKLLDVLEPFKNTYFQ